MAAPGKLHNRTALITGGGSGIGRGITKRYLEEGCRVAIAGRSELKLQEAWEQLGSGERLIFQACDVAQPEQVKSLVEWATKKLGRIDILVNNAGLNLKKREVRTLTPEAAVGQIRDAALKAKAAAGL